MKTIRLFKSLGVLSLLAFSWSASATGLDHWTWRNPLPSGIDMSTLYFRGMTFTNGMYVAVGDQGLAWYSTDASNWTSQATSTATTLNGIASVNGIFIAVGDGGALETSTDGTNWNLRNSGTVSSLRAVAYGNGIYVVVGPEVILTSTNAVNWTAHAGGFTSVTFGSAGFMATFGGTGSQGGAGTMVYTSLDGVSWSGQPIYEGPFYTNFFNLGFPIQHDVVTFGSGRYMVASWRYIGSAAMQPYIFSSTDAVNWDTNVLAPINSTSVFSYRMFAADEGRALAVGFYGGGGTRCEFTADGSNWNSGTLIGSAMPTAASCAGGRYLIASLVSVLGPPFNRRAVFTSTDGTNWQNNPAALPFGPNSTFTSIASNNNAYVVATSSSMVRSSNDLVYVTVSNSPTLSSLIPFGGGFMAVGAGGKIYQSGDGLSWTQRNSGTLSDLRGITAGGGLLVAVGANGAIQTSTTGTIWTTRTSGTSLALYGIAYSNGLFVAVGQLGTVLTSPDGINWTGQDSGQLQNLLSVTSGSAGFVAVGVQGTIVSSPDGVNWTQQGSGSTVNFQSVTFGNGYYLVCGNNAVVLTSLDAANWTPRAVNAAGQNLQGAAFINGRFFVVGTAGTVLESDVVAPAFELQIHANTSSKWLNVFSPAGSNFRIQTTTNIVSPVWTDAASFSNVLANTQWTIPADSAGQRIYRAVTP